MKTVSCRVKDEEYQMLHERAYNQSLYSEEMVTVSDLIRDAILRVYKPLNLEERLAQKLHASGLIFNQK